MENYLEERRNIENPFHPSHIYPNRLTVSPFAKKKKTKTTTKRSRTENNRDNKRQRKARKLEGCFLPPKATLPIFTLASQAATKTTTTTTTAMAHSPPAIPILPATVTTTPTQSCKVCRIRGKPCPFSTKPAQPLHY